jgi:hypothetical protein
VPLILSFVHVAAWYVLASRDPDMVLWRVGPFFTLGDLLLWELTAATGIVLVWSFFGLRAAAGSARCASS